MAWELLAQFPLPPAPGPYLLAGEFEGYSQLLVGVALAPGFGREYWSRAGHFWLQLEVPGLGWERCWRYQCYLRENLITLPSLGPARFEFDPEYWVEEYELSVWGQLAPATGLDGGIY